MPAPLLATQTAPPPAAMPVGRAGTVIVVVTALVSGSIRETVSSPTFATQTAPSPAAIATGDCPTVVVAVTAPALRGSIRMTSLSMSSETHTAPQPGVDPARAVSDRNPGDHLTALGIDAGEAARRPPDPHGSGPNRDRIHGGVRKLLGVRREVDRLSRADARVEPHELRRPGARQPDAAVAGREAADVGAGGDCAGCGQLVGVDTGDAVVGVVCDPDGVAVRRHVDGLYPGRDRLGELRGGWVDDRKRVRRRKLGSPPPEARTTAITAASSAPPPKPRSTPPLCRWRRSASEPGAAVRRCLDPG